jgi:hypothetical protein
VISARPHKVHRSVRLPSPTIRAFDAIRTEERERETQFLYVYLHRRLRAAATSYVGTKYWILLHAQSVCSCKRVLNHSRELNDPHSKSRLRSRSLQNLRNCAIRKKVGLWDRHVYFCVLTFTPSTAVEFSRNLSELVSCSW